MRATLNWKSWLEFQSVERIDHSQPVTFLDQFCKFVRNVFDVAKYFFRIVLSASYNHENRVIPGPELVMGVNKVTDDLVTVETSRTLGARIWPGEQRHVKAYSIGAIDERSLLCDSDKSLLAVRALNEVSLQQSTPVAGAIS